MQMFDGVETDGVLNKNFLVPKVLPDTLLVVEVIFHIGVFSRGVGDGGIRKPILIGDETGDDTAVGFG